MRHRKAGVKLNRTTSHRQAMFRNMVTSLFKYERIRTTDAKAKELRRWADQMITLAKRGDLHARRQALAVIREKAVVHKLFEEAPERFGSVNGGYTRIVRLARRAGDAAPISMIELVVPEADEKKPKRRKKAREAAEVKVEETPVADTATDSEEASAPEPEEASEPEAEAAADTPADDPDSSEPEAEEPVEASAESDATDEGAGKEEETGESEETKPEE